MFQKFLTRLAEDHTGDVTPRMMAMLAVEPGTINQKVAALDREIKTVASADHDMRRLMEIPGVGPTIATALGAAVRNAKAFGKGRDLAARLGLVPLAKSQPGAWPQSADELTRHRTRDFPSWSGDNHNAPAKDRTHRSRVKGASQNRLQRKAGHTSPRKFP